GAQVLFLNVGVVILVVAYRQQHGDPAGRLVIARLNDARIALRGVFEQLATSRMNVGNDGATHPYRVILLGHRPEFSQVVDAEIDPADKSQLAVDNHDLPVQAPEQVGAHA